jgi:hypothetical protein
MIIMKNPAPNTKGITAKRPSRASLRQRAFAITASLLAIAASTVVMSASPAHASGVGISPTTLEYNEALRGGTFVQTLLLSNEASKAGTPGSTGDAKLLKFDLETKGETAKWITFVSPDNPTPTTTFKVAKGQRAQVEVQVRIPKDAPNRPYVGSVFISAQEVSDGVLTSGAGVSTAADIPVTINVGGQERRAATVGDFIVDNGEVGLLQRFRAKVLNTGNVSVAAQLEVALTREGKEVTTLTSAGQNFPVNPLQDGEVFIDWPTAEQLGGAYNAKFTVSDVSGPTPIILGKNDVEFRLEPRGTFTRTGTFNSIKVLEVPEVGGLAVVEGTFTNTGKIDTNAIFDGQVMLNGKLTKSQQSLPRTIRPGETAAINLSFDAPTAGTYTLVGKINFDGQLSEEKSVEVVVGTKSTGTKSSGSTNPAVFAGGGALALFGGVGTVIALRRRHRRLESA